MSIRNAPIGLAVAAAVLVAAGAADAQNRLKLFGLKVALDCHIIQLKEMVVTNMTSSVIAAGTTIGFDATRYPGGEHYGGSFASRALGFGASVHRGTDQSTSCTAWYYQTPFLNIAPQNQLRSP